MPGNDALVLGTMGAFLVLAVVVSSVNKGSLEGMLPEQRKGFESVSDFPERRDDGWRWPEDRVIPDYSSPVSNSNRKHR